MGKVFYRDDKEKMVFGVCKGIADYSDVDVALVRILAIVGLFFSFGMVFLVYIILALVLPAKSQLSNQERRNTTNKTYKMPKKELDEYELDPDDYKL